MVLFSVDCKLQADVPPCEKNQKPGRHLMKAQWSRLMMPPLGAGHRECSWQGVLRMALNSLICTHSTECVGWLLCCSCCCCCCCQRYAWELS